MKKVTNTLYFYLLLLLFLLKSVHCKHSKIRVVLFSGLCLFPKVVLIFWVVLIFLCCTSFLDCIDFLGPFLGLCLFYSVYHSFHLSDTTAVLDKSNLVMIIIFVKITKDHCSNDPQSTIWNAIFCWRNFLHFCTVFRKIWPNNRLASISWVDALVIFINWKLIKNFILLIILNKNRK